MGDDDGPGGKEVSGGRADVQCRPPLLSAQRLQLPVQQQHRHSRALCQNHWDIPARDMNLVLWAIIALTISCEAVDIKETEESSTPESLEVAKNFRKALYEALEQLEKDEVQNSNSTSNDFEKDDLDASDYDEDERTKFGHKIRDNISKQEAIVTSFTDADKASVFVHSFSTNTHDNKPSTEKKKEVESTTHQYRSKITPDNVISASVTSPVAGNNNQITSTNKKLSVRVIPTPTTPVSTLTSPRPTISTPVEEEDETKAKVEDVQFIHAPLVAAFTVEQDDNGLPHKVIPIFGNKQQAQNINNFSNSIPRPNVQISLEQKQKQLEQQIQFLQEQKRQQELLLQQQLRQKQIFDSQQHRFNTQNDIHSFRQTQDQFNNQLFPLNSVTNFPKVFTHPTQNLSSQNIINHQTRINIPIPTQTEANTLSRRPAKDVSGTVVSFQPSISFQPNGFNQANPFVSQNSQFQPSNHIQQTSQQSFNNFNHQQQLPVKGAVDFQKAIHIPVTQPDNHLTQQLLPNQFRDNVFNNDNYLQDFFYRQRTLVPPPPRGNRVFRQETNVGNFGINDVNHNQHRFNQATNFKFNNEPQQLRYHHHNNFNFNPRPVSNQFFTHQHIQPNHVDTRLKNLLYQSGLGQGRTQEDLNIVSKVLALDHTGNYQQNFLFGESNVSEKRLPFNHSNRALKT